MDANTQEIYNYLKQKYKRATVNKREIAHELGVSISTIDLYISRGVGVCRYRKLGNKKNSRVVFNIVDLAEFLSDTIETM